MIYIIVPVYKRFSTSLKFFKSLKSNSNYKVIIVDDGCEYVYEEFVNTMPSYHYVRGSGNLFWGGAVNLGLAFVKCNFDLNQSDFIILANDDVVLRHDTLDNLIKSCDLGFDIIHPLVVNNSGICVSSGSKLVSTLLFITKHPFRNMHFNDVRRNEYVKIDILTGRFLMVRAGIFQTYGGIRTEYFQHYGGDADLGIRLRNRINCYIDTSSIVELDVTTTGLNAGTPISFSKFVKSLFSIRSSNNLRVRFLLSVLNFNLLIVSINAIALVPNVVIANLYYLVRSKLHKLFNKR